MAASIVTSFFLSSTFAIAVCQSGWDLMAITDYDNLILQTVPCILEISNKYFNTGQPIGGSIILVSLDPNNPILQQRILKEVLYKNSPYDWTVIINDRNPRNNYESIEKAKNYFTIIDSFEEILGIVNKWKKLSTWNPLAQVIILLGVELNTIDLESNKRNLMTLLLQNRVLNAYILSIQQNSSRVEVSTLFPYDEGNCADRVLTISIMDTCEYDPAVDLNVDIDNIALWEVNNHYENKLPNDLHRCPLMASARVWEPYALYESDKNEFNFGIDVNIVKTIAETLNLELLITPQNGSIYEVYDEVIQGGVDLMIGGVDKDPSMADYTSSTIPYYQDDLTWCVAKAGPSVTWMKIFGMFDQMTWFGILMFVVVSTVFIFGFQFLIVKKHMIVRSILASISLILNQPVLATKYTLAFQFAMLGFIIFGMLINVMYQSVLITVLTKPLLEPQIKLVEQLVSLQMRLLGGDEVTRNLDQSKSMQDYILDHLQTCRNVDDCLKSLSHNKKLAVAASREHVVSNPRIQRENIYCFSILENIYSYLVAFITVRNYHLLDKFNRIIRLISEAGLITKWKSELDHLITMREEYSRVNDDGPKPLKFQELYGVFVISAITLVVSFISLILEMIVFRVARRKNAGKIWIYIDEKLLTNRERIDVHSSRECFNE